MGDTIVIFDPEADPGLKFPSPAVRDEIGELAPIFVEADSVTESKIADAAVTEPKLKSGSVTASKLASGAVTADALANGAVTSTKLESGAVTADKAGVGVVTAINSAGDPLTVNLEILTAAAYAALTPDPNTLYFVT